MKKYSLEDISNINKEIKVFINFKCDNRHIKNYAKFYNDGHHFRFLIFETDEEFYLPFNDDLFTNRVIDEEFIEVFEY